MLWCLTITGKGHACLVMCWSCTLVHYFLKKKSYPNHHWSHSLCLWLKKYRGFFRKSCHYEDQPSGPSRFHFFSSLNFIISTFTSHYISTLVLQVIYHRYFLKNLEEIIFCIIVITFWEKHYFSISGSERHNF